MLRQVRRHLGGSLNDLVDARESSKMVLGLFRIWEFLRVKLAQRREPRFSPFLWLADEFAWLCYQPVYDHGLKEPPLVYLNGGYSPFTLTRNERFQAESVPQELIRSRPLVEVMESLPFPVIGVPWYQIRNIADLPVIGHEVGHSVEIDLRLTEAISGAIRGAVVDPVRRLRWNEWASEIFADLYGAVGSGSAFVSALANFLSTEDRQEEAEGYPPASIRFRYNVEVLRATGCDSDCDKLSARWNDVFPMSAPFAEYVRDAPAVAIALLNEFSGGGKKGLEWVHLAEDQRRAHDLATRALQRGEISKNEPLRALVAAYRFAYDEIVENKDPLTAAASLCRLDRLESAMQEGLKPDLRAGETTPKPAELAARADAHRRRAAFWLTAMTGKSP
jgi:hypothetical protein